MRKIFVAAQVVLLVLSAMVWSGSRQTTRAAEAVLAQDQSAQDGQVLNAPQTRRRRRRVRGDVGRRRGARARFARAGRHYGRSGRYAGRGGARFAKNIVRGKPIKAGAELGKNVGKSGAEVGKGTADVGVGVAKVGAKTAKTVGKAGAKTGKAVGRGVKRVFTP